jgi:ActR/RegA family two-component response regulator
MAEIKILLVDDDRDEIFLTKRLLEKKGCDVVSATSVSEALLQIATEPFDALVTDLHMPDPGDGFAVVTAMHHTQPEALTLVVSGYPDVQKAMATILLQADEILVKPLDVERLSELLRQKLSNGKATPKQAKETVASILERDAPITIQRWLSRVEAVGELTALPLTTDERTRHLPGILRNIAVRLRALRTLEAIATPSAAAVAHGELRCRQGYTAPLLVQESRMLQVCIFETIQRNLATVDFTLVLPDIMLIADEVDSQLTQSIDRFLTVQKGLAAASA